MMAQTNQPMGSSPLANMQAQLGANMQPGQAMPAGWQNQMLAMRGMQPQVPGAGAAQPVPQNPQNLAQYGAQLGQPRMGAAPGQLPQQATGQVRQLGRLNTMQPRQPMQAMPPMGAPGRGPGQGKAGNPAQMQAMKQQIARLPGAPGGVTPR